MAKLNYKRTKYPTYYEDAKATTKKNGKAYFYYDCEGRRRRNYNEIKTVLCCSFKYEIQLKDNEIGSLKKEISTKDKIIGRLQAEKEKLKQKLMK